MPIGRVTQVVDCREAMGMGKGGGIAQRGTISECRYPDVIVVGMSPGRRHVTKPVCDITSGLRQQGVEYSISTLVLNAGSGVPPDAPKIAGGVIGAYFGLTDKEIVQIENPVQLAGGHSHEELWVPADELVEFNQRIVGKIEVIESYPGPNFQGNVDPASHLPGDFETCA